MTPHIEKIRQKNKNVFTIEWADGKIVDYRLGDLQKTALVQSVMIRQQVSEQALRLLLMKM